MRKILLVLITLSTLIAGCAKKEGCTYSTSTNYDSSAEKDDGSCIFANAKDTTEEEKCSYTLGKITETALGSYTAPNGDVYSNSGTYQVVILNVAGCDSIITINLTITSLSKIGDYRDGGIVFWVDSFGGGLVCAITDQSSGIQWYNGFQKWTGAGGSAIGKGQDNTAKIINALGAKETNYAAGLAKAYPGGGFTDWFLPSKLELKEMNLNKNVINTTAAANGGNALSNVYWSSTEYNTDYAYIFLFPAGDSFNNSKDGTSAVRAIRTF